MDMFFVLLPAPGPSSEVSPASLFPAIEAALSLSHRHIVTSIR
jgi:hypothetical protein